LKNDRKKGEYSLLLGDDVLSILERSLVETTWVLWGLKIWNEKHLQRVRLSLCEAATMEMSLEKL
jgi:hypothetical protein